uniref:Uncharacterized protein n=1 Tax=Anthurium amnicola TaxID=1678845 RepID=A0A1D1ZHF0_9ARAE
MRTAFLLAILILATSVSKAYGESENTAAVPIKDEVQISSYSSSSDLGKDSVNPENGSATGGGNSGNNMNSENNPGDEANYPPSGPSIDTHYRISYPQYLKMSPNLPKRP